MKRSRFSEPVYFQVSGLAAGKSYETRYEFFREGDDAKHPPRLALKFTDTGSLPRREMARTLGLKNLDPGKYRLVVTVKGDAQQAIAQTILTAAK